MVRHLIDKALTKSKDIISNACLLDTRPTTTTTTTTTTTITTTTTTTTATTFNNNNNNYITLKKSQYINRSK